MWRKNPGESEVEEQGPRGGADRPGWGRGTAAASGQPRRRAGEPREGRERGRVPAPTVSTFLRREGQSSDENRATGEGLEEGQETVTGAVENGRER